MIRIAAIFLFTIAGISVYSQESDLVPGELLIQLDKNTDEILLSNEVYEMMGMLPSFEVKRCISKPMRTWLCTFDHEAVDQFELLRMVRSFGFVTNAQFNHVLTNRDTTPDDPFYPNQWHHHDPEDNDIDSDLAWDITTGGLTITNDEIVACVVETGGASWNHIDLAANHWVNELEIPSNSIDDDNNGYIDDYNGWNISSNSDVIAGGNHGTQVSSMIGATGDNNTGIAGVNWNVRLMQVQMGNVNEANVIEAYTYPLVMRKLYNETNGAEGAFVVVTNSSWGIDGGQPENSPLWCAMYDSLGTYGVLSCGATANNAVNVDIVGDLPTACPSDYMISVTATDANDIRDFSAYGLTTIDLAAPGDQVYLASNTNNYGNATGTSFASPCVAGAVALMYSAPCISLMGLVLASPGEGALAVRNYLLDGVDPVANLAAEVATGGRLNVNNAIELLMNDCSSSGCIAPFGIVVSLIAESTDYIASWNSTSDMDEFSVRYRPVGSSEWTTITGITTDNVSLQGLLLCTEYELQVMAACDAEESNWSGSVYWLTVGCCDNPMISTFDIVSLESTSIELSWEEIFAANGYFVDITDIDGNTDEFTAVTNSILIVGLDPCAQYIITVQTLCEELQAPQPETFIVNTPGCADCTDMNYCEISGNANTEWIANVTLNTIDNQTLSDGGYGDYSDISTTLDIGQSYLISLTPGYSSASFTEYFMVWIDFNVNSVFEESELVYDSGDAVTTTVTGEIFIPWTASQGATRMRVGMSWVGALGGGGEPVPCGSNTYGETEDYCIVINTDVSNAELSENKILLFPNPASDFIRLTNDRGMVVISNVSGEKVIEQIASEANASINISSLPAGIYVVKYVFNNKEIIERFAVR